MKIFNRNQTSYFGLLMIGCISVISLFGTTQVEAQQLPFFSSYVYNPHLLSPSAAGDLSDPSQVARLMLAHRFQYAGFEGAPTTSLVSIDAPFSGQNMGIGGLLYTDKIGLIRQTGMQFNYAYRMKLGEKFTWHLGLGANIGQQSIDLEAARAEDMSEEIINLPSANKVYANGNFGTHLSHKRGMIGFAVHQFTKSRMLYKNYVSDQSFTYDQPAHFIGFASYLIRLKGDEMGISPIVTVRSAKNTDLQYDLMLKAHYKNKLYLTAGYRSDYAISFGAGAELNHRLTLSYTYDHMINDAGPFTGGGHEFTLGFRFFKPGEKPMEYQAPQTTSNLDRGLTQEQVDALFEERLAEIKENMEAMKSENAEKSAEIHRLSERIDSLKMTPAEIKTESEKVIIRDGKVENKIVFFATNSAKLTEASMLELDQITAFMLQHKDIKLQIHGHSDGAGSADANLLLSQKRAESVFSYLKARGVPDQRLSRQGFGESKPITTNDTETGRNINRRVELIIE